MEAGIRETAEMAHEAAQADIEPEDKDLAAAKQQRGQM